VLCLKNRLFHQNKLLANMKATLVLKEAYKFAFIIFEATSTCPGAVPPRRLRSVWGSEG